MVCEEASVGVEMPKGVVAPTPELRRRVWPQHTAALLATLLAMSGGIVMGWSTPAVPYLQEALPLNDGTNGTTIPITDEEGSWLGSLSAIGALVGAAPAGFLSDLVGRKRMLLLFSVPLIASWVMIILVERNIPLLYLARVLGGSTTGVCYALIPVYSEEISEVRFRGVICSYCEVMNCVGIVISYAVGNYAQYFHFNVFSCCVPVMFLLTFLWMPESPMWLLMKGRDPEAEKSLRWLRGAAPGADKGIEEEMEEMRTFLKMEEELSSESTENLLGPTGGARPLWTPTVKVAFIVFWLMVFQQMNGNNSVLFNAVTVFQSASSSLDSRVAAIITVVLQAIAAAVSSVIVDMAGRRPLMILSMVACFFLLTIMALYLQFQAQLEGMGWVPVVVLSTFIATVEVGFGPLPWLMMAELSPAHAKKTIGAIGCAANWSLVFVVTKSYSSMVSSLGMPWTYGVYAMFCVTGAVFVYFVVPETKHKTREQIQYELRYGRGSENLNSDKFANTRKL